MTAARQALGSLGVGLAGLVIVVVVGAIAYAGFELHAIYQAIVVGHSHTYNLLEEVCRTTPRCVIPKGAS